MQKFEDATFKDEACRTQVPVENLHAAEESGQELVHYLNTKNGP
jgi:hypothetical protein